MNGNGRENMPKFSDFDLDFATGQNGEELVKELLTGGKTVEVKTDIKWKNTGNLYIETICWYNASSEWLPSGLSVTKADYWGFVLEGTVLLVQTEYLRIAVAQYGYPINCNIPPNPSKGYLIKPEHILAIVKEQTRTIDK
jgi:hypothetical protein